MEGMSIFQADLDDTGHQSAILELVDMYAREPMGGGRPLPDSVRAGMIPGLRAHPTTVVFLARVGDVPVGVAVCFGGFSTFAAKPLLNIHDLAVRPEFRGRGIGRGLMEAAEAHARAMGCCKLTLEVLETNALARKAYHAFGFNPLSYTGDTGSCLFYAKPL
ncbi:MAG: putative acetyltransferase [Fibrobacteres bacterium]|nr:putative acetyltransferase [Fibrobacterota bacterium]